MTTMLDRPREDRRAVNGGAPPAIGGGYALRRYWFIPLVLAIVFGAAGYVYAHSKPVRYTASSELAVGTTNANTPEALGGFAQSGPTLAAAYSRAVYADQVVGSVSSKLKRSTGDVRGHINATVIPTTPVVRIDATGSSSGDVVALANTAADGLSAYAGALNGSDTNAKSLLRRYQHASEAVARAQSAVGNTVSNSASERAAKAKLASARLEAETLATSYRNNQQGQGASNPLQVLERATGATDNRKSNLQLYTVAGAIGGLVVGWALAILAGNRRLRRERIYGS
jgi:uncharacterized protein involved in exopolysaccharide biosynthesis